MRALFKVVGIGAEDVRVQNLTCPAFEYVVSRLAFRDEATMSIGDVYSASDHGADNPSDFLLEQKAPAKVTPEAKLADEATFRFVPGFAAQSASDAESFLLRDSEGAFVVINGQTQRLADGWRVRVKSLQELYS